MSEDNRPKNGWDIVGDIVGFILFLFLILLVCEGIPEPIEKWWRGSNTSTSEVKVNK